MPAPVFNIHETFASKLKCFVIQCEPRLRFQNLNSERASEQERAHELQWNTAENFKRLNSNKRKINFHRVELFCTSKSCSLPFSHCSRQANRQAGNQQTRNPFWQLEIGPVNVFSPNVYLKFSNIFATRNMLLLLLVLVLYYGCLSIVLQMFIIAYGR